RRRSTNRAALTSGRPPAPRPCPSSSGEGTTIMFTKLTISRVYRPGPNLRENTGSVSPVGRVLALVLAAPVVAAGVWLAAPTAFPQPAPNGVPPTAATPPDRRGLQPRHPILLRAGGALAHYRVPPAGSLLRDSP